MPRHRHARTFLLAASLVLLYPATRAAAAAGRDYEIRMDRPAKVGDTYGLEVAAVSRTRVTITVGNVASVKVKDESADVRLTGRAEVLAVGDRAEVTKVACRIESCTATVGGATTELLPKGAVVVAEWKDGKTYYARDGRAVAARTAKLLDDVLAIEQPDALRNNAVFGTKDPQRVGAEWPIDAELAAKDLTTGKDMEFRKENVTGRTKLAGVPDVGGVPCLELVMSLAGKQPRGTTKGEDGMTIEGREVRVTLTTLLPQDGKTGPLRTTHDVNIHTVLTGESEDGKPVRMNAGIEQRVEKKYKRE